ncbi:Unknown protein [Striga hermonthica]|uniref:WRC domain-containing protein n=1 Tax=Striga hermonthica TaxID=68872 RepID=A0A9N7NFY1_STRHE|nr:Unknown protein [Striga hermonthica]
MAPLKKRKGSFERTPLNDEIISISSTSKMQSKTNKKCDDQIPVIVEANGITNDFSTKNKSKRGKVIMEGSRCSRINGRGWRCHQPTLVGYSLCEHHLGKGRLRSVAANRQVPEMSGLPPLSEAEQPALTVRKKRNKVGVVKARSMSSLLSQI